MSHKVILTKLLVFGLAISTLHQGNSAYAEMPFIGQAFTGVESWAARLDDDDSNNFGLVSGINSALPLGDLGFDLQTGFSYGVYDLMGHEQGNTQSAEEQIFTTIGFSRKADTSTGERFSGGVVWDYLSDKNVGEEHNAVIDLHQLRMRLGMAVRDDLELGVWGTVNLNDEDYTSANAGVISVQALDQANIYLEKVTSRGARILGYLGYLEEPGEFVLGVRGSIPISDFWSMGAQFAYGKPSTVAGDLAPNGVEQSYSEAYWMVGFGLTYHFGGGCASCQNGPLMSVANNATFMVQAPVGAL